MNLKYKLNKKTGQKLETLYENMKMKLYENKTSLKITRKNAEYIKIFIRLNKSQFSIKRVYQNPEK